MAGPDASQPALSESAHEVLRLREHAYRLKVRANHFRDRAETAERAMRDIRRELDAIHRRLRDAKGNHT